MPITTIFFDVGGTLMYPDMERLMEPLLRRVRPSAEQMATADRAAKYSYPKNGDDAPRSNRGHWYVYFETLVATLGCCRELLPELAARAGDSSYWTRVDAAAAPTLARLKPSYRLGVISNADGRIREVLARGGLAQFFASITDSGLVGYEKPDPRIFRAALQALGAAPGESLYVGDIYAVDYEGAVAADMRAVLVDPDDVYDGIAAPRLRSLAELEPWLRTELP